ncbi:hypothetical protein BDR26DRAFT_975223 [Obelidium mucronatum]|nr:hypothetical protein BDR26DRAFT_975223 [Obelidium mucronatum]
MLQAGQAAILAQLQQQHQQRLRQQAAAQPRMPPRPTSPPPIYAQPPADLPPAASTFALHPDHLASLDRALAYPEPFLRELVAPESAEFEFLVAELLAPILGQLQFFTIERVTNAGLLAQFEARRRQLRVLKTRSAQTLGECGLAARQAALMLAAHAAFDAKHQRAPCSAGCDFADNCALLFHGSRGAAESVLADGLDARLASATGLHGAGLYFADDPRKALAYVRGKATLFVCLVLLGDCVFSRPTPGRAREPRKALPGRTCGDRCFDSVAWAAAAGYPEYVVYNSAQCVPLYAVTYITKTDAVVPAPGVRDLAEMPFVLVPRFVWGFDEGANPGLKRQPPGAPFRLHASVFFANLNKALEKGREKAAAELIKSLEEEEDNLSADLWDGGGDDGGGDGIGGGGDSDDSRDNEIKIEDGDDDDDDDDGDVDDHNGIEEM